LIVWPDPGDETEGVDSLQTGLRKNPLPFDASSISRTGVPPLTRLPFLPGAALRRLALVISLAVVAASASSCHLIFGEPSMDPCDPAHNYYEGDRHYISRDYVQEDGTLDQQKMLEALRPGYGDCADPEEIIRKKQTPSSSYENKVPAKQDSEIKFPDSDLK
tara:strand:+ start:429457 stop:429942 length:486 start_codon:yes stop_codon:yes gene_type:complete